MNKILETYRLTIRPLSIADKNFLIKLVDTEHWLQCIEDRNETNANDDEQYIL